MKRAWIQMPQEIYDLAENRRKKLFLPSFTEYVRTLIRKDLSDYLSEAATEIAAQPVDVKALARALADEEGG